MSDIILINATSNEIPIADESVHLWYNSPSHTTNRIAGRFDFIAADPPYSKTRHSFLGKAPFVSGGLASPGWSCGNGSTVYGGRFAMPKRKLPPNDFLIGLYNGGLSAKEVAEKIGANVNTVSSLLTRLGVMRTPEETKLLQKGRGVIQRITRYWLGKNMPAELVEKRAEKIRGEKHYLWKGGIERRGYRKVVVKECCIKCGSKSRLAIHHKDLDHYNNDPDNLEVLCMSCHSSIHKKAYWDAVHAGRKPPKSNAPINWKRGIK